MAKETFIELCINKKKNKKQNKKLFPNRCTEVGLVEVLEGDVKFFGKKETGRCDFAIKVIFKLMISIQK